MVNSRSNSQINSPDSSSLSASFTLVEEHKYRGDKYDKYDKYKYAFNDKKMKLITKGLLRKTMVDHGMNTEKKVDQNKIITLLTYHNQIIELIDNSSEFYEFTKLIKSDSGQSSNILYLCIMAISGTGKYLSTNAESLGKAVVDIAQKTVTDTFSVPSSLLDTIVKEIKRYCFDQPSTLSKATQALSNNVLSKFKEGAISVAEKAATDQIRKIGELMKKCLRIYKENNINKVTLTDEDFKAINKLYIMLRPEDKSQNKWYKAAFETAEGIGTNNAPVYIPTVEGEVLDEIKSLYFDTWEIL
ncbi:hypothetical protein [Xenorhabdus stockiae]|uniref:hypothetical protein n=1 Tax=Xenorhabdus stockiae TaxID=351614 RepID=UPI00406399B2